MKEQQPQFEYKPISIDKAIANIFELAEKNNWLVYGHGTETKYQAELILERGLYSEGEVEVTSTLGTTTLHLEGAEQVRKWPHEERRFVALIVIPAMPSDYPYDLSGQDYQDMYFEPLTDGLSELHNSILPPDYIAGYFDATNDSFITNPKFDPKPHHKTPRPRPNSLESRGEIYQNDSPKTEESNDEDWVG